ncbi:MULTISPECIES: Tn3 family transposase [Streptomyces]|uniref:Tn3 family transposase n=1 Tax=Streptomyces lycopersici TaxID=2974589 RepID=UPI0035243667
MAASCGISYDVLAWPAEWYIREETLREANICLVNYHHQLPMTSMFGSGTPSSADGQRLPAQGQVDHRAAPEQVLRRRGHLHLHPRE